MSPKIKLNSVLSGAKILTVHWILASSEVKFLFSEVIGFTYCLLSSIPTSNRPTVLSCDITGNGTVYTGKASCTATSSRATSSSTETVTWF